MSEIKKLVEALPEVYQNIYGHSEFDEDSSRNCDIRKSCIIEIVKAFQDKLGKKELKVLDLGCAQGYYSFSVAELGCQVDGIDFCKENIDLCKALQNENGLPCNYKHDKITKELVDAIDDGAYDVIMFYSVVHHICNENGFEYARGLFETLANKSQIVLTELALKEEPLYWNKNLPEQYDDWFDNVAFYDEQRMFDTHLSEYKRPLILYSNKYCYLDKKYYTIDEYKNKAYTGKKDNINKRYYLCDNRTVLIKRFSKETDDIFKDELRREIFILDKYDFSFAPKLIAAGDEFGRVIEATSIHYGRILRDLILEKQEIDFKKVFKWVLDNCCELEEKGLYHSDLRAWNICVDDDGKAFIIDLGAVSCEKRDIVLEKQYGNVNQITVFDGFLSLVYDCMISNIYIKDIELMDHYHPSLYFDYSRIPDAFAYFIKKCIVLTNEITFKHIRSIYSTVLDDMMDKSLSESEQVLVLQHQLRGVAMLKENSIDSERRIAILQKQMLDQSEQIQEQIKQMSILQHQCLQLQSEINSINNWIFLRAYKRIKNIFGH